MAVRSGKLTQAPSRLSAFMQWVFLLSAMLVGVLTIVILYQLYRVYIGGTWTSENIVLAVVSLNLSATVALFGLIYNINGKLERHLGECA